LTQALVAVFCQPDIEIGLHFLQRSCIFCLESFPVNGTLWMKNLLAVVGPITRLFVVRAKVCGGGLFFPMAAYQS